MRKLLALCLSLMVGCACEHENYRIKGMRGPNTEIASWGKLVDAWDGNVQTITLYCNACNAQVGSGHIHWVRRGIPE